MLLKKKGSLKFGGLLLAIILVVNMFVQYTPVMPDVEASTTASDEPVYNDETCIKSTTKDSLTVQANSSAGGGFGIGTAITGQQSYYVCFTIFGDVTGSGTVYFDFRGSQARMALSGTQCTAIGGTKNQAVNCDTGLFTEAGSKVTIYSTPSTATIWINGNKCIEDYAFTEANCNLTGTPKISWTPANIEVTDICVWTETDTPSYDADTCNLKYSNADTGSFTGAYAFDNVTIANSETYYISYTVTSTSTFYLFVRDKVKLTMTAGLCRIDQGNEVGAGDASKTVTTNMASGAKIAICTTPTTVSVWVNKVLVIDNLALNSNYQYAGGIPSVNYGNAATLTNVKVWTKKSEPAFDATKHVSVKRIESQTVAAAGSASLMGANVATNQEYWANFNIQSTSSIYFVFRGTSSQAEIAITTTTCAIQEVIGGTRTAQTRWFKHAGGLETTGMSITIHSTPTHISLWINKDKVVDNFALTNVNLEGVPKVRYATAETTISNLNIWVTAAGDEPVYDADTCILRNAIEGTQMDIEATKSANLGKQIPADKTYYISFVLQTTSSIYIDFRGTANDFYLVYNAEGRYNVYEKSTGSNKYTGTWPSYLGNLPAEGIRITICSAPDKATIWMNGLKVEEYEHVSTNAFVGAPKISYTKEEATLTDLYVWTEKNPDEWHDVSTYKADGSYPTAPEGKIFAGWYKDDMNFSPETALGKAENTGQAYALFVDEDVLTVKWQVKADVATSDSTDLRLITSVDSGNYTNVGFAISYNGTSMGNRVATTVYTELPGFEAGTVQNYSPTVFSPSSKYFMSYRFNGLTSSTYDKTFVVEPFWTTLDGTVVYGTQNTFTISDAKEFEESI